MITNKMQLVVAAQDFTRATMTVTDPHALGKARHEAFEALGIPGEHYPEFSNECNALRNRFQQLEQQVIKQPEPAK